MQRRSRRAAATTLNNALMQSGAGAEAQATVFGIFGNSTASRPIAGRKAQKS